MPAATSNHIGITAVSQPTHVHDLVDRKLKTVAIGGAMIAILDALHDLEEALADRHNDALASEIVAPLSDAVRPCWDRIDEAAVKRPSLCSQS